MYPFDDYVSQAIFHHLCALLMGQLADIFTKDCVNSVEFEATTNHRACQLLGRKTTGDKGRCLLWQRRSCC